MPAAGQPAILCGQEDIHGHRDKKEPGKRPGKKAFHFPPTADVAKIAGRDFVIMALVDFEEWQEDLALSALMAERLATDEELIPLEEVERGV